MGQIGTRGRKRQAGRDGEGLQAGTATLRKGLKVLDLVSVSRTPVRLADVMAGAGLPRSTAHRLLQALTDEGLLRSDARPGGTYALGPRLLSLARGAWNGFDVRTAAAIDLTRLQDLSGGTVLLAVYSESGAVCVEVLPGRSGSRLDIGIGTVLPLHATAVGKAILAGLPPQSLGGHIGRLVLTPTTPRTITDAAQLTGDIELSRSRLYAVEDEECEVGIRAVAAPIFDASGTSCGALGIAGPASQLPLDGLHALAAEVIEAAKRASQTSSGYPVVADAGDNPFGGRSQAVCVVPSHAFAGESPAWSATDGRLYWIDVVGPALHVLDPLASRYSSMPLPSLVGAVVPRASGGVVVALQTGLSHLDTRTGCLTDLPGCDLRAGQRIRSLAADRAGRLWITVMDAAATAGAGSVWRLGPDGGRPVKVLDRMDIPNSPGWSPDGETLYLADASAQQVFAFDFDRQRGTLSSRRPFGPQAPGRGRPAGLAVDTEGYVWVAYRDGWCVTRFTPDGDVDRIVTLPVPRPSGCAFGGSDMSRLYLTTARIRLSHRSLERAPLSGSLLAYDTGVGGLPRHSFGG